MHFTCDRVSALPLLLSELVADGNGTAGPTPRVGKRSVKFSEGALDDDCRNQYILILCIKYNQIIKKHTQMRKLSLFSCVKGIIVVLMLLSRSHSHPSHML